MVLTSKKFNKKEYNGLIIGMLLGDASIRINRGGKNASISMRHSIQQTEYIDFKKNILSSLTSINENTLLTRLADKVFKQIEINTKVHPIYTKLFKKIIINNKKTVSYDLLKRLTPLGLALWYMDDGSLTIHYAKNKIGNRITNGREVNFHTEGFSYEENIIIQEYFKKYLDINVKIHRTKKIYFKIYLNGTEAKKLFNIINPYIISSMQYKIDMKYCN